MTWVQSLVLAVLQGVTELFPISSLGHTVIVTALLGWGDLESSPNFLPFLVLFHVGTATALFIYFWRDWFAIIQGFFVTAAKGRLDAHPQGRLAWLLIAGTIPAGMIGLFLENPLKGLFANPVVAAGFLAINGIILLVGERARRHALATEAAHGAALAGSIPPTASTPSTASTEEALDASVAGSSATTEEAHGASLAGSAGSTPSTEAAHGASLGGSAGSAGSTEEARGAALAGSSAAAVNGSGSLGVPLGSVAVAESSAAQPAQLRRFQSLSWREAILVGLAQALALIPGISRSGVTMVAALRVGMTHEDAAAYTFLLATPIIGAAAVLELPQLASVPSSILVIALVGGIVAGVAAYLSTRFLMRYFENGRLDPFGYYCIIAGVLSGVYLTLHP